MDAQCLMRMKIIFMQSISLKLVLRIRYDKKLNHYSQDYKCLHGLEVKTVNFMRNFREHITFLLSRRGQRPDRDPVTPQEHAGS